MSSKRPTEEKPLPETTATLADLESWQPEGTALAVLGYPIKHSLSPAMHNAALAEMAKTWPEFAEWTYYRFEVAPERLGQALTRFHALGFRGLNLTVPHKVLALEEVTGASKEGVEMGAVNTLHWQTDGYYGYNTDGYGLREGLRHEFGIALKDRHVVLLGAGGAARAAARLCLEEGCASLWIANRSLDRLQELMSDLKGCEGTSARHALALQDILEAELPEQVVLINSTSCGLAADDPTPLPVQALNEGWIVYDMIYRLGDTTLVREARNRGLQAAGGLSMLVYQGAKSLEIWSGKPVPVEVMFRAAQQRLQNGNS